MTKIIIHSPAIPKKENLRKLYDAMNKVFYDDKIFYSNDEIKTLKNNKNNIFLN